MNFTFAEIESWARLNDIKLIPFEIKTLKHLSNEFTSQYYSDIDVAPYGGNKKDVSAKLKDALKMLKRK